MTPLRSARFIGRGSVHGRSATNSWGTTTLGGLTPDSRVLDVGCGQGRMAVPLLPPPFRSRQLRWLRHRVDWHPLVLREHFRESRKFPLPPCGHPHRGIQPRRQLRGRRVPFPLRRRQLPPAFLTSISRACGPSKWRTTWPTLGARAQAGRAVPRDLVPAQRGIMCAHCRQSCGIVLSWTILMAASSRTRTFRRRLSPTLRELVEGMYASAGLSPAPGRYGGGRPHRLPQLPGHLRGDPPRLG